MKHLLHWLTTHLLHLLHIAHSPAVGVFVGRARTHDAAKPKKPTLEQLVKEWLKESLLDAKDLPGEILPQENARTIEFFDIDRKCIPEAAIERRFAVPNSFVPEPPDPDPKYLHPAGVRPHLYYPLNVPKDYNWRTQKTLVFVEGAKKAACMGAFGIPAIGIEGCWGFRAVKHGLLILPEFNDHALEDCDVYWVPDRDRKPESVRDVQRASASFALLLKERGARPHVVHLPLLEGYKKVGVDDFMVDRSRVGKDKRAARAAFDDLLAGTPVWEDFDLTDAGYAKRWVSLYKSDFLYVDGQRSWRTYRNGVWRNDDLLERQEACIQMFDNLEQDARNIGDTERAGMVRRQSTAERLTSGVLKVARSNPDIITSANSLDRHPYLVNCANGTLEMPYDKSGKLVFREHRPDDLLTKAVSVKWDEDAECPVFMAALDYWTNGDKGLQRTVQQLLGISLTGVTREQSFIILWGPPQSGKSTLMEITQQIAASYAVTLSSDTLLLRRNGKEEERKLATLPGARFALASETEQGGVVNENLLKMLTGEDTVAARMLYQETFNFVPEAKIWLRTNNKPEIRSTDNSMWRRIIILPFGHVVPEDKKDGFLKDKLRQELEGIFTWMVHGYVDYVQNGLFKAAVVEKVKDEYRREQNILERYFEDKCEFDPEYSEHRVNLQYSIGRDELYAGFAQWCRDNGVRIIPPVKMFKTDIKEYFKERMREQKVSVHKKQEWRWLGINTKVNLFSSAKY